LKLEGKGTKLLSVQEFIFILLSQEQIVLLNVLRNKIKCGASEEF
jgi:hypothetical protein